MPDSNQKAVVQSRADATLTDEPMGELVKRISDDLTTIAKDVIALGRIEITRELKTTLGDVAGIVLGGVVALIAIGLMCSGVVVALAPLIHSLAARMFLMSGIYAGVGFLVARIYIKRIGGDSIGAPRAQREAVTTVKAISEKVQHG